MTCLGKAEWQQWGGRSCQWAGHSALTGPRPPGVYISFEGENIFLEKKIGHVPFVSFGSLGDFILFNEPALLAGFLKLFSKPWGVYDLERWHKPRRGSRKSVLCADDFSAHHCLSGAALCSGPAARLIPHWPLKWVHALLFQRDRKPQLGMSKGFLFTLLYDDYSKAWCLAVK